MGLKEKMMEGMMGKMSPEEKEEMMGKMMELFFSEMSSEEKQKIMQNMMEKFMGSMSTEEKQKMFQEMMPKMMQGMMGGEGPMGMMSSMMKRMMGEKGEGPMDMCKKMMGNIEKVFELSIYSTSELHTLFEEWLSQIEEEIATKIKEKGEIDSKKLSEEFKLSEESINFILLRLAKKGKIKVNAGSI